MPKAKKIIKAYPPRFKSKMHIWFEVECCFRSWHLPVDSSYILTVNKTYPTLDIDWICPRCSSVHEEGNKYD